MTGGSPASCTPTTLSSVLSERATYIQTALHAVSAWRFKFRFRMGVGPIMSGAKVFGTRRSAFACCVILGARASLWFHLTSTLEWSSLPPCHGHGTLNSWFNVVTGSLRSCVVVPFRTTAHHFGIICFHVFFLPSVVWRADVFARSPPALRILVHALRKWGRHSLGWPTKSPHAGVLMELGWPDADRLSKERVLSIYGHIFALGVTAGCPKPSTVFQIASAGPGTWIYDSQDVCVPRSKHLLLLWTLHCLADLFLTCRPLVRRSGAASSRQCSTGAFGRSSFRALCNSRSLVRSGFALWSRGTIRTHVRFVGEVCDRLLASAER